MADTAVAAPTKAPKKKTAGDLGEIIMCFFNNFYDNFPYDSVKTSCKLHVKIFIRHSPVRRAYKYTVHGERGIESLQMNDFTTKISFYADEIYH
jgi:hypothetical protein